MAINAAASLEMVIRHATEMDDDYEDIAPTLAELESDADITLLPQLRKEREAFLDTRNFYGRDLNTGLLAAIEGPAALALLPWASTRDLGDDQDSRQRQIVELLHADRTAGRAIVRALSRVEEPAARRVGLWALGFVVEPQDADLLCAAAADSDQNIRPTAIGALPDPAGDDRRR